MDIIQRKSTTVVLLAQTGNARAVQATDSAQETMILRTGADGDIRNVGTEQYRSGTRTTQHHNAWHLQ